MSKYINKYFNWLGIQNEAMRRSLKVVFVFVLIIPHTTWEISYFYNNMFDSWVDFFKGTFAFLFITLAFIGSFTSTLKCITWIKQGYDKDRTY